jgi:hypothetical protein
MQERFENTEGEQDPEDARGSARRVPSYVTRWI